MFSRSGRFGRFAGEQVKANFRHIRHFRHFSSLESLMHVVVCIKQVPDAKNVRIDPETCTLVRQGVESIVNPHDWYAVEAALRFRDEYGGKVTALTMGPPQAEEALRETLALGVDEAVLLSDRAFAGADTWATSLTLARAIEKLGPVELVIAG